ncbi:MAG: RsfS/YbeB/iojap family protein [Lachnospiraceae bacterium]
MQKANEMAKLAVEALEDKKATGYQNSGYCFRFTLADYFIIAGGSNRNQVQAMCDNVQEKLGRAGYTECRENGYEAANWILLDFGDICGTSV